MNHPFPAQVPEALDAWLASAPKKDWVRTVDGGRLVSRLKAVDRASLDLPLASAPSLDVVWALATLEGVNDHAICDVARRVLRGDVAVPTADRLRGLAGLTPSFHEAEGEDPRAAAPKATRAADLESSLADVGDARHLALTFPHLDLDAANLARLYDLGALCCAKTLPGEVRKALRCADCGGPKAKIKTRVCDACLRADDETPRRRRPEAYVG